MKQQIIEWFASNRDYNKGFELLKIASSKIKVIKMLSKGYSKFNAEKLVWELHSIAGLSEKECYTKPVSDGKPVAEMKKNDIKNEKLHQQKSGSDLTDRKDLPKEIQELISEKGILIRKRAICQAEMGDITGNSVKAKTARKKLREEIEAQVSRIDEITAIVVLYDTKGIIPGSEPAKVNTEPAEVNTSDEAALIKKRTNLRSQLSKAKKSAAEKKGAKQKEYQAKAEKIEAELMVIQENLDKFTAK